MPATARDQRLVQKARGMAPEYPQPQIIVFACLHPLVEPAALLEQCGGHHRGRTTDEAQMQGRLEDVAAPLEMAQPGVYPPPIANPNLLGLDQWILRMA